MMEKNNDIHKFYWDLTYINKLLDYLDLRVNSELDQAIDSDVDNDVMRKLIIERVTIKKVKGMFNLPENNIEELLNE